MSTVMNLLVQAQERDIINGVHGRLGDLATIDPQYDVAVSTACGMLDYIVVQTTAGAAAPRKRCGIGRPSTYASIIGTIISRGYVVKEEKRLYPTEIGMTVTDMLVEYFLPSIPQNFLCAVAESRNHPATINRDHTSG